MKMRRDFRREDNTTKRITKIRNIELRAISIGPKPFLFMFGVSFMLRKGCFPLKKKVFLFIVECLPPFFSPLCSPYLVSLPLFTFSLSLSLSLSCYFIVFFLPCLLSFFPSFFFCFLPCFFAFVSCKEEHQDITSERFFSSMFILFGCFPVFV